MGSVTQVAAAVSFTLAVVAGAADALTWTETSWQDFSDGQFSDNLYVSHRDSGTIEFEWAFDLNKDGYCDLMCADWTGPYLRVYFGDSTGYSIQRRRLLPIGYGGGCDVGDLDCDGHPDLVHSGWHSGASIFRGTDSGPDPANPQQLDADGAETVTIDDLDRDGYLDLIFPGEDATLAIYWGSADGYSPSRRTRIPFGHGLSHNATVADLDKDGFRDVVLCMYEGSSQQPVVYFGVNRTYRIEWLDYLSSGSYGPHGTTVADFDRDGWLDIVYSGYSGIDQSYVYFGSDSGFSDSRRTIVTPGVCYGGSAACDFNGDGWLDLIYFRGNGNYGGYWKPIMFLNTGSAPHFSDGQTQLVGPEAVALSGGLATDFDRDGSLDIYLDGYDPYGSNHTPSMVLWGPGWIMADTLPNLVDHHGMFREPGNIYDRSYREDYLSSVFDGDTPTSWHTVSWDDSTPGGALVEVAVRTGTTAAPDPTWSGWYAMANGDTVPDSLDSRYIQYRATLRYQNPASLPMLFEVRIDYGPDLMYDVGPTAILTPVGTVDSGTQVMPTVVVRNFGTSSATFPATLLIGSGYSETLSDTLATGSVDTLRFPVWTAYSVGTTGVVCFSGLVGDEDPANDTIRDSLRVVGPPVHDVGAVAILDPTGTVRTGDTVIPRARVKNFGNAVERFFSVRFRMGASYNRTASEAQTLYPDSVVELTFAPWVAASGTWAVSCSTMLVSDVNRANDKVASTVRAFARLLHVEPDQSDRLEVGEGKTYQFYAFIDGDTGGVVELARPAAPAGWSLRLADATGTNDLTDTDADGIPDLGYVVAGETSRFSLEVQTPSGLAGDTASFTQRTFVVAGHLGNDSTVADTALLDLTLLPGFSVHNFPNPFSTSTTFVIGLPADGKVSLTVYTRAGERVCRVLNREDKSAGVQVVGWDGVNDNGRAVAPGTYEYMLDYVHQGKTDRIRKRLVVTRE
jgi:hypothetical protein